MCGIFGMIHHEGGHKVNEVFLRSATQKLYHRGPDGEGYFVENNIGLGHRRLSIIDLSDRGKQPMEKHGLVISYNGELYNYKTLRSDLEQMGYRFHSHSDTEVILSAYDQWGEDAVHRFSGMWAFIIYDRVKKHITLSRDQWGMKPLFIFNAEGFTCFSSEIKAFTIFKEWNGELNKDSVYDYLANGLIYHNRDTMFQSVHSMEPGSLLRLDSKGKELESFNFQINEDHFLNSNSPPDQFSNLFSQSVKRHFVADVPVACALSGGLDSSAIVQEAAEQELLLDTFTFTVNEKSYSESEYVLELKNKLEISNHQIRPSFQEHLEAHQDAIMANEAPALSMNLISSYLLYQTVHRKGYKVLLAGQGADELLCGYHFYFVPYLKFLSKKSPVMAAKMLLSLGIHYPSKFSSVINKEKSNLDLFLFHQKNESEDSAANFQNFYLNQLTWGHLQRLLIFEDHLSMANSVEARLPFLDQTFSRYCIGLDFKYKLHLSETKYLLRKVMKGRLPDSITNRKDKMGFVSPQELWIQQNRTYFFSEIKKSIQKHPGWIDEKVISFLDSGKAKTIHQDIWRLYSFFKFLDLEF
ncbi:asparagine synthase (glutamine-hydrolyzing) [Portibacter marinus]|uniref:asparagine synthase (glutamine-hydrolyzing) n=1 Tax=Portibacter marinus TaxID=2898660 RepID=UPI001F32EF80|nr:asparagine synthase (glutamine-hydrolyzing) [Portibacter marinus]